MIAEIGLFALVLALLLAAFQSVVPLIGAHRGDVTLMQTASVTAIVQFVFTATAFAALTACYVLSDFSVVNVYENSHSAMP
ncbi:MAG: heme lyase NrfEFG subunit NrfE, partial [Xanthobacteraceae bacterium]